MTDETPVKLLRPVTRRVRTVYEWDEVVAMSPDGNWPKAVGFGRKYRGSRVLSQGEPEETTEILSWDYLDAETAIAPAGLLEAITLLSKAARNNYARMYKADKILTRYTSYARRDLVKKLFYRSGKSDPKLVQPVDPTRQHTRFRTPKIGRASDWAAYMSNDQAWVVFTVEDYNGQVNMIQTLVYTGGVWQHTTPTDLWNAQGAAFDLALLVL